MNTSSIKTQRKKSFRVTFAPGTKTEEEQLSNFVRAVEHQGPGIDDLSQMIKSLPNKKNASHTKEAQSISNMIVQLRKTLDNMLEKECTTTFISNNNDKNNCSFLPSKIPVLKNNMKIITNEEIIEVPERRSSNSSISSIDSAISDCEHSNEYYKNLENCEKNEIKDKKDINTIVSSPRTRQKVTNLLKELNTCIEELREYDLSTDDESNNLTAFSSNEALINENTCVKDIFAEGILIASFVQIGYNKMPLQQQYSVLSDNRLYIFKSNRSKSPLSNIFDFTNLSTVNKISFDNNRCALVVTGKFNDIFGKTISNDITLVFSSEEEGNIWYKLLMYVIKMNCPFLNNNETLETTIITTNTSRSMNVNKNYNQNSFEVDHYNPRQTILSALCVLENVNNKIAIK